MASDISFIHYVCEQLEDCGNITFKKMFGEYMIYVNFKPIILVCDNTPHVKKLDDIRDLMIKAEVGIPYDGAKEHYILDIDDQNLVRNVIGILEKVTQVPKPKKKKAA
jgi:TfoX/Sxy family transcriptional regulator of competence genes